MGCAMPDRTIGQHLDDTLAQLATKQDLKDAVRELVQVINRNTKELRQDLNRVGIPVRTRPRASGAE